MNDPNDLNAENKRVWEEYIAEFSYVEKEEDFANLLDAHLVEEVVPSSITPVSETKRHQQFVTPHNNTAQRPQLDRRTEEKLRKGKIPIEARIDLHGMSREKAYEALGRFILSCSQRKLRHVLVITGKGKSQSTSDEWLSKGCGVLKTNVPYWLDSAILKPKILKYMKAQPKDGGSGALYVYLKRQR